ncbi:hypothetical protein N7517_003289 [Penicillium concentricum]|uniref:Nitrate reductase [NADPH] n=1 Tax=Penicillium concentricum TaxID=293559 RepID=A0A9W9SYH5_9EURO|nr:uncharacterized protein N7517_003289 [Penicillium concentricum]KAJ5385378.1 hypothetical protein N7517_003289 [Penicillium concentricum]
MIDIREQEEREFLVQSKKEEAELNKTLGEHDLISIREFMTKQEDYHLRFPQNHPQGWRYVLHTMEDFIKYKQDWPVKLERRRQKEEEKANEIHKEEENHKRQNEDEWRLGGIVAAPTTNGEEVHEDVGRNDGKVKSPLNLTKEQGLSIDEADQFTPDNWIPRSSCLIRLTGKHPLNGEPELQALYGAGLITPNQLHFVRNHGAVPHLLWETHKLHVENGKRKLVISMDNLANDFEAINIAVALACDGNQRKELNMIRRSKGFNWGAGPISCAFWKGPLQRDVLLAAGVRVPDPCLGKGRRWVNFEGADELSEGKYATSIPLAYAMDSENDVILAYEMNNMRLLSDHGYPVRLIIPGYVGGRCVKWLHKVYVSDKENDSRYHIWDNRVLPGFIRDMDSEFSRTIFSHPSTACNEQNLNSIIVKPGQGIAYDGGGHEVQRVEVSLDGGETWLYCIRKFPEYPIRHGKKFWTWLHWYVDVGLPHLVRAKSITVRCFNVFKNTQPETPSWNIMGMMNNCWYTVLPEIREDSKNEYSVLLFRHPCEPGTGTGGWMQASTENYVENIKHEVTSPQKQFTREEIEKHNKENDCWVVINGKVYDATSVLDWHPGGKAPIMAHADSVHADTTDEFESIHDDYAQQKLSVLGEVTEKAMGFIKKQVEAVAKEKARSSKKHSDIILEHRRWNVVRFKEKEQLSEDTHRYTFSLPLESRRLGLGTCQHLKLGFHFKDRLVVRPYTPTRPVFGKEEDGTFDLVVKTYAPDQSQPGRTMSNILDCLHSGEEIDVKRPIGEIKYIGQGKFKIDDKEYHFYNVSLVLGGSGITPGYQLISRILRAKSQGESEDMTNLKVIDANKTEGDILLREDLDKLANNHSDQLQITHVLSHPDDNWKGEKGHVTKEIPQRYFFGPEEGNVALLCGPPTMIQKFVLPALQDIGYREDRNLFGF